jgi:hypothetical protein
MCNFGEFAEHIISGRQGRDIAQDASSKTTTPDERTVERLFNGRHAAAFSFDVLLPHENGMNGVSQRTAFQEIERIIENNVEDAQKSGRWRGALMNDVDMAERFCKRILGARLQDTAPYLMAEITAEGRRRNINVKSKEETTGYTYEVYSHCKSSRSSQTMASETQKEDFKEWVKNLSSEQPRLPYLQHQRFNTMLSHLKIIKDVRNTYYTPKSC